jgi:hypothetical protein
MYVWRVEPSEAWTAFVMYVGTVHTVEGREAWTAFVMYVGTVHTAIFDDLSRQISCSVCKSAFLMQSYLVLLCLPLHHTLSNKIMLILPCETRDWKAHSHCTVVLDGCDFFSCQGLLKNKMQENLYLGKGREREINTLRRQRGR